MEKRTNKKINKILAFGITTFFIFGTYNLFDNLKYQNGRLNFYSILVLSILSMYFAIIVHLVLYSFGMFLFGKIIGYKFISISIFHLKFKRSCNKIKITYDKKNETVCYMAPPDKVNNHYPYILFFLGGIILDFIFILVLSFMLVISVNSQLKLIIVSALGIIAAIIVMDIIPINYKGRPNKGLSLYNMHRDIENRRAFWLYYNLEYRMINGANYKDIPEEWFNIPQNVDFNHPSTAQIGFFRCLYLHTLGQYRDAKELSDLIIKKGPESLKFSKLVLLSEQLFYEVIGPCRKEEIDNLLSVDLQKYLNEKQYISNKRILYAYEVLVNKDNKEAEKRLNEFENLSVNYEYPGELINERNIIRMIYNKVNTAE